MFADELVPERGGWTIAFLLVVGVMGKVVLKRKVSLIGWCPFGMLDPKWSLEWRLKNSG
jgi:hypothetical protein